MKESQKNRKMAKGKRVLIEILKIFVTSFKISLCVNVLLLILNSIAGGFIGFKFYIMLTMLMTMSLTPCWILCDSKRIFNNKVHKANNTKRIYRKTKSKNSTTKRKKIS